MRIRPINDLIAVRLEAEQETSGSILIPETAREFPRVGVVVAVGNGRWLKNGERKPVGVRVGDRIGMYQQDGAEFLLDGEKLRLIRETNVLGVVRRDGEDDHDGHREA